MKIFAQARKEPQTEEEWQEAVDLAHAALSFDAAKQFGLLTGGPEVFTERCREILHRGAKRGTRPSKNAIARFVEDVQQC